MGAAVLAALMLPTGVDARVEIESTSLGSVSSIRAQVTVDFDPRYVFNPDTGQSELVIPREVLSDDDGVDDAAPNIGLPDLLNAQIPLETRSFVDEDGITVTRSAYGFSDLLMGVEEDPAAGITEIASTFSHDVSYSRTPEGYTGCCTASVDAQANVGFKVIITGAPVVVDVSLGYSGDRGSGAGFRLRGNDIDIDIRKDFDDDNESAFADSATETLPPGTYQLTQYSYANSRSNIYGPRQFEGDTTVTFEAGPPRVVLVFEEPANAAIREEEVFGATFHNVIVDGQATLLPFATTASSAFEAFKESTRASVQGVLDRASAGSLEIEDLEVVVGPSQEGASNVYFVDGAQLAVPGLEGRAYTGVDQFNESAHGEAFVVLRSNDDLTGESAEKIAERTAHEAGHLLGLIHIDPNGAEAVMDYDHQGNQQEAFSNGLFALTQPPRAGGLVHDDITHNPLYHLLRYTGGRSHDELTASNVFPGTWDLQRAAELGVQISANFENLGGGIEGSTVFYDVSVLEADGDPASPILIERFDEVTFDELAEVEFLIKEGSGLLLLARSQPEGDRDVAMAWGDPFEEHGLVLYPGIGDEMGLLQIESDTPVGYETLASLDLQVRQVPEPSGTLLSLVATCTAMALRARAAAKART